MTTLTWNERKHYVGVDHGVVYSKTGSVAVWNGLMSVVEKPTDIRERVRYRDGRRFVNHRKEDSFAATVECLTYPEGLLSSRSTFDMSYRVKTSSGYEIHLVYNALAYASSKTYAQNEVTPFTFDISTKPMLMPMNHAPSAHLIIDSVQTSSDALSALEKILYGEEYSDPRMPLAEELVDVFDVNALFKVIDNGDGTFTLEAPDEVFKWLGDTLFEVDWPRPPVFIDENTYVIQNW